VIKLQRGDIVQDIPLFNTENGIASLRLKEIPFFQTAYITIQSTLEERKLLDDCVGLCKAAGAERIYATCLKKAEYGDPINIIRMARDLSSQEETDAMLFPVQQETLPLWREIYNQKMRSVTGAAYMNDAMARQLLAEKSGYFVHRNRELIGIGTACDDKITVVASVQKGAGKDVVNALLSALTNDRAIIEVAADNLKAIELYSSLGFVATGIVTSWYKII